jgi:D-alanine--poly(phosphoribitol) ligase subunit 1
MLPSDPLELFLKHTEARPDHPAVVERGRTLSYGEMLSLSRRIAKALGRQESQPRTLIHLPQCAEAYAAMFASLMIGGTYAPTNVTAPPERQRNIMRAFEPMAIVTERGRVHDLEISAEDPRLIFIDALPEEEIEIFPEPHDLAYVIFTSGSTGTPKGVMIPRVGLAHYVQWSLQAMNTTPDDRWSQHPNIGFDLSVLDIYGALCAGATLYPLVSRSDRLLPSEAIRRHKLTIWNSVPSVIDLMTKGNRSTTEHFKSLRLFTFCGEPLLPAHLEEIFSARPDITVHNTYGPTEATVSFTLIRLTQENYQDACAHNVALGDAIPGMHLYLIDGESEDEGEIVVAGPQVARGYWRGPDITATSFGRKSFGDQSLASYRTGDWGKIRNNQLYFESRIDRQVKLHGNRFELGEIDSSLRACGAAAACTILWRNQLHAFLEFKDNSETDTVEIRNRLVELLPSYAVPEIFHVVQTLPRNANDKIDSKALESDLERAGFPNSKTIIH